MLIRISLIIALVASLAATGIGFVYVKDKIVTTMNERDQEKSQKEIAQKELASTKKTLKKTEEDLTTTKQDLASTRTKLQSETARANDLDKQKTELTGELADAKGARDAAQQKLIQWDLIGRTPDQVKQALADLKSTTKERDVVSAENKTLLRERNRLQAKLDELIGPPQDPPLPIGLKGHIVAVDPKYDFVVLDIGENEGVLERGVMLVNRGGKLVAKVRITSVSPERSIANVLPEWRQAEVFEGDQVLY
jgi:hypothetical protein